MKKGSYLDIAVFCSIHYHPEESIRAKHCAILVSKKGNQYIGYNRRKSHPLQDKFKRNPHSIFLHAEIEAILKALKAGEDISKCNLYVARTLKDKSHTIGNSKPCKGCMEAIHYFGIKHIEHTNG